MIQPGHDSIGFVPVESVLRGLLSWVHFGNAFRFGNVHSGKPARPIVVIRPCAAPARAALAEKSVGGYCQQPLALPAGLQVRLQFLADLRKQQEQTDHVGEHHRENHRVGELDD